MNTEASNRVLLVLYSYHHRNTEKIAQVISELESRHVVYEGGRP